MRSPLRVCKVNNAKLHVNLLLSLGHEEKLHYVLATGAGLDAIKQLL